MPLCTENKAVLYTISLGTELYFLALSEATIQNSQFYQTKFSKVLCKILKINLHKIAENLTFLSRLAENLIIQTITNAQILTIMTYKQRPRHREAFN